MTKLSELAPTKQARVMDLVAEAGIDVSDWKNFKGGVKKAASNPNYCYSWAFYEPNEVAVFNLWHDSMEEKNGLIFREMNARQEAADLKFKGTVAKRALFMDEVIQSVLKNKTPIKAIICGRKRGASTAGTSSRVTARFLDSEIWSISKYDMNTGRCIFVRGNTFPAGMPVDATTPTILINQSFKKWLVGIGKSENTAINYSNAINGVMSQWAVEKGWINKSLLEINDVSVFETVSNKIRGLPIYKARNTKGKSMYNAALRAYSAYLSDVTGYDIKKDIDDILTNKAIAETEKDALVKARIGQGRFRIDLINYWGRCAVTGYKNISLLVASHIKPWKHANNHERLDAGNGLLLLPNIDKAFDLGHVTFKSTGKIIISSELESPATLGLRDDMKISLSKPHQPYMEFHRSEVFEKLIR